MTSSTSSVLLNKITGKRIFANGVCVCIWKPGHKRLEFAKLENEHLYSNYRVIKKLYKKNTRRNFTPVATTNTTKDDDSSDDEEYDSSDEGGLPLKFKSIHIRRENSKDDEKIKDIYSVKEASLALITTMSGKVAYLSPNINNGKPVFIKEFDSYSPVEKIFETPEKVFAFSTRDEKNPLFGCTIFESMGGKVLDFKIEPIDKWVKQDHLPAFNNVEEDIGFIRLDQVDDPNHFDSSWGQIFFKSTGKCLVWGFKAYSQFHPEASSLINKQLKGKTPDQVFVDLPTVEKELNYQFDNWRIPFELLIKPLSVCALGKTNGLGVTKDGYLWFFGYETPKIDNLYSLNYHKLNLPKSVERPDGDELSGGKMFLNGSGNVLLNPQTGDVYKWNETKVDLPGESHCFIPIHMPVILADMIIVSPNLILGTDEEDGVYLLRDEPSSMSERRLLLQRAKF